MFADVVLSILGHVNGLMNNGNGNEDQAPTKGNGNSHEDMNGSLDKVTNGSEVVPIPPEDSPGGSPKVEPGESP